jgi:hypothetical protein
MYEFTKQLKRKVVIQNEIMIHFGFPKSIANSQKPYSDEAWREKKLKHKLDKMFFSILDSTFNEEFYTQKTRLNPSNKAPLVGFKIRLKRLEENTTLEGIVAKSILLNTHYMYDKVNDMAELLDVIDKMDSTSFLQDNNISTFTIVSTTHKIKEVPIVWKGLD